MSSFCETIAAGNNLVIDVQFFGTTTSISSQCKHVIYRIIQELVHNIVKHAEATHAIVQGTVNENSFSLIVEDNGLGFDLTTAQYGIGLQNVKARVSSLNGELQVESTIGKGTSVYIELNCQQDTQ